jgi:hypothetical protein
LAKLKTGGGSEFLGLRFTVEQIDFLKKFPLLFFIPYFAIRLFDWTFLTSVIAAFESSALAALGFANERIGSIIFVAGASGGSEAFDLVVDCSGAVMIIMFLALYYATGDFSGKNENKNRKENKKEKPRSPWPYVPLLFVFNLGRILVTLAVGLSFGAFALQATHFVLWFVDSAFVIACWAHAKRIEFRV